MFHYLCALGKGLVFCTAVLLLPSSVGAQTSPSGHVPARTTYPLRITSPPPFSIFPGDHMFQATMKIEHGSQYAERMAQIASSRPRAWTATIQEKPAALEAVVTEPEELTEMIKIRGPNGEVRSFPIVGGRKAIKARTIIVRPGQSLQLMIGGGTATAARK